MFPIIDLMPEDIVDYLVKDSQYISEVSQEYDLSWQAVQKGFIGELETYTSFEKIPIIDEYRFIRKNFHHFWVIYVLLLRLLSFKNPLVELHSFFKTRSIRQFKIIDSIIPYNHFITFKSPLILEDPLVTVVIPTLNRYIYLQDVLEDLERQDYKNFEVMMVDQSEPFKPEFYKDFQLNIKLIRQEEKALWLARNTAIKQAKGEYLLLFDDDSRVNSDWIRQHLKCLDFFKADLSSGVSISKVGAKVPANYGFFRISDQLDTGNVLIKKEVFKDIGLFDRQYEKQRMGDGEFGLRAYLQGYLNVSNPFAKRLHLKVGSGGLREMGSWDGFRPKKWFGPRPVPSVLYQFRTYYGNKRAILALFKMVPPSIIPYQFKGNKIMMLLGYVISVCLFPIILAQVLRSWHLASLKLQEGQKIERL
ncbi:glycosyltransferase family 2 protein [Xanthomarina gelatinilytica]|uniref:glycosyltransferase family 2 protein n=1 Tax=Xanthomarina gelatinilytica TaxID=1137281 RepID=UPI003AA88112